MKIPAEGSYRVIREGFANYWVQQQLEGYWEYVRPYTTKWGAILAVKRRIAEREEKKRKKARGIQVVWEERT